MKILSMDQKHNLIHIHLAKGAKSVWLIHEWTSPLKPTEDDILKMVEAWRLVANFNPDFLVSLGVKRQVVEDEIYRAAVFVRRFDAMMEESS